MRWGASALGVVCIVSKKKRYEHDYLDGELVRDLEYNETFVFRDKTDGFRAQMNPKMLRRANEEEKREFEKYKEPQRP